MLHSSDTNALEDPKGLANPFSIAISYKTNSAMVRIISFDQHFSLANTTYVDTGNWSCLIN